MPHGLQIHFLSSRVLLKIAEKQSPRTPRQLQWSVPSCQLVKRPLGSPKRTLAASSTTACTSGSVATHGVDS